VHLTFDDGPTSARDGTGVTVEVLDTLAEHDVNATFFLHGIAINEWEGPLLARMLHDGHAIGNHLWQHGRNTVRDKTPLMRLVDQYLMAEIRIREVLRITDDTAFARYLAQPKLFRRPGGDPTLNSFLEPATITRLKAKVRTQWYREHLLWLDGVYDYSGWHCTLGDSMPHLKYRATTVAEGLKYLLSGVHGYTGVDSYLCAGDPAQRSVEAAQGLIVLLHDASPVTRKALPTVIHELRARGAVFAPLPRSADGPNQQAVSIAIPPTPDPQSGLCQPHS
jgi:peptidoglycan/xylan/chitin deacetylase (PgdA/CDA1 family)